MSDPSRIQYEYLRQLESLMRQPAASRQPASAPNVVQLSPDMTDEQYRDFLATASLAELQAVAAENEAAANVQLNVRNLERARFFASRAEAAREQIAAISRDQEADQHRQAMDWTLEQYRARLSDLEQQARGKTE